MIHGTCSVGSEVILVCKTRLSGGFFLGMLINMLLNIRGLIPTVVLLILHFALKISFWWAAGAFAAWIIYLILWMVFIGWAGRCGNTCALPKKNKNPYSVVNTESRRCNAGVDRENFDEPV